MTGTHEHHRPLGMPRNYSVPRETHLLLLLLLNLELV